MSVYLYEFLYRGQPDGTGDFHVVLAGASTDAFGVVTTQQSQAMTPDQAAAAGFPLPTLIAGINGAMATTAAGLQTQLAGAQAQISTLQTQLTAAQDQVTALQHAATLVDAAPTPA